MKPLPPWRLFLGGLLIGFSIGVCAARASAAVPPPPEQPHTDVFEVAGWPAPALQALNPISTKLRAGSRVVTYRYQVMPGCADGNMHQTLRAAMNASTIYVGLSFQEVSTGYDLTIRANCGTGFTNVCGPAAIACLGRGFPYVNDIDASTQMAAFFDVSQISIWLHELLGHALATWHEQYCLGTETSGHCAGRAQFSAAPNFVSFMNTGPDSRLIWPQNDVDRWERSMYVLPAPDCSGPTDVYGNVWDSCLARWIAPNGWRYDPATGVWELPDGTLEWSACDGFGNRWSIFLYYATGGRLEFFPSVTGGFYDVQRGFWSWAPGC